MIRRWGRKRRRVWKIWMYPSKHDLVRVIMMHVWSAAFTLDGMSLRSHTYRSRGP